MRLQEPLCSSLTRNGYITLAANEYRASESEGRAATLLDHECAIQRSIRQSRTGNSDEPILIVIHGIHDGLVATAAQTVDSNLPNANQLLDQQPLPDGVARNLPAAENPSSVSMSLTFSDNNQTAPDKLLRCPWHFLDADEPCKTMFRYIRDVIRHSRRHGFFFCSRCSQSTIDRQEGTRHSCDVKACVDLACPNRAGK
jgi:hypothetical protein